MGVTVSGMATVNKKLDRFANLAKPVNSATKRTLSGAKTEASKAIREEVALKKAYVDGTLFGRANYLKPDGTGDAYIVVSAKRRGILLRNFQKGFNKKQGALMEIKRGRPMRIKKAFIITLKNGIKTVVWRKEGAKGRKIDTGVFALHGPSPSQVLDSKADVIADAVADRFSKNLDHALKRYIDNGVT